VICCYIFIAYDSFPDKPAYFCYYMYFFRSPGRMGHVSYCHHLASVVVVVVNIFSKIFSSETTWQNSMKVGIVVP